ncbi:MAG: HEAT repeat domain-containing protein [Terriglobales bacterium]
MSKIARVPLRGLLFFYRRSSGFTAEKDGPLWFSGGYWFCPSRQHGIQRHSHHRERRQLAGSRRRCPGSWPTIPTLTPKNALVSAATGDKHELVRTACLDALARRGDPAVIDRIASALSDDKDSVKYTAAAAIVHLSDVAERRRRRRR